MIEIKPAWTFVRERRYLALRTGVAAATASVGPTFARGLLPRSTSDQAILSATAAAYWLGFSALGLSTVEAVSELVVKARRSGSPETVALGTSAVVALAGTGVVAAIPNSHEVPLGLAVTRSTAWVITGGAMASALVIGTDKAMEATVGQRGLPTNLAVAAGIGACATGVRVAMRNRRAAAQGEGPAAQRRAVVVDTEPASLARSAAMGAAAGAGLLALAGTHFAIAEGTTTMVSRALDRAADPVTPLVGHAAAASVLAGAAALGLTRIRSHVLRTGDQVEPAYPDPPTSEHVTAGPTSVVAFDAIGKEGRRFVLMALDPRGDHGGHGGTGDRPGARGGRVRQRDDARGSGQDRPGRDGATRRLRPLPDRGGRTHGGRLRQLLLR